MSTDATGVVDADLARVVSTQAHFAAVQGEQVAVGSATPGDVKRRHAAVAAAEAALTQAQAALTQLEQQRRRRVPRRPARATPG